MAKVSAGILMYRIHAGKPQVLLVHPGGPFWKNKDLGAWSIPKGEVEDGEDLLDAAKREFFEETGQRVMGDAVPLQPIRQKSGKIVHAWAVHGSIDASSIKSNTFSMEWPPRSGKQAQFPEIDRAEYFGFDIARKKINPAQIALIDELARCI